MALYAWQGPCKNRDLRLIGNGILSAISYFDLKFDEKELPYLPDSDFQKYNHRCDHSNSSFRPQFSHRQDSRRHENCYGCPKFICAVPNIGVVVKH
jgi:hypothetical protein